MYGLNNNTGMAKSQQDNNIERLGRKMSNAKRSKSVINHIIAQMQRL